MSAFTIIIIRVYYAIRATDDANNIAKPSNVASLNLLIAPPVIPTLPPQIKLPSTTTTPSTDTTSTQPVCELINEYYGFQWTGFLPIKKNLTKKAGKTKFCPCAYSICEFGHLTPLRHGNRSTK